MRNNIEPPFSLKIGACWRNELVFQSLPASKGRQTTMSKVTSKDGTTIAFDRVGEGPAVIVVGGGPTTRVVNSAVAELLAPSCSVFNYDRRGHGDNLSGLYCLE